MLTHDRRVTSSEAPVVAQPVPARPLAPALSVASVTALSATAGNQAVARMLATSRLLQRVKAKLGDELSADVSQAEATEMEAAWAAIARYKSVTVDSRTVAEQLRAKYPQHEGSKQITPGEWYRDEVIGLRDALRAGEHLLGISRKMTKTANDYVMTVIKDPSIGWVFGKVSGTVNEKTGQFDALSDYGETVVKPKVGYIGLTGDCHKKALEFEPEPTGSVGETSEARSRREDRAATAALVHEMAHTVYNAYSATWKPFLKGEGKGEQAPTKYARDKQNSEEDFCDSVMAWLLYPEQLRDRAPLRAAWLDKNARELAAPTAAGPLSPAAAKT